MRSLFLSLSLCLAAIGATSDRAEAQLCYGCGASADVFIDGNDDCGAVNPFDGNVVTCDSCTFSTRITLSSCIDGFCDNVVVDPPYAVCMEVDPCRYFITWSYSSTCNGVVPSFSASSSGCLGSTGTPFRYLTSAQIPASLPRTGPPGSYRPVIASSPHELQPMSCGADDCDYTFSITRPSAGCAGLSSTVSLRVECDGCHREGDPD